MKQSANRSFIVPYWSGYAAALSEMVCKNFKEVNSRDYPPEEIQRLVNTHQPDALHAVSYTHLEEGDQLYTQALRNLYVNCKDPVEIMAWTETFDHLEKCCDACEDVAEIVESVIMKNT